MALYTCTGSHGTTGDGLYRFSTLKNPYLDPSHSSVALISQKLESGGVAVEGAPGTRVEGHVGHVYRALGTPGDGPDGFSTPKTPQLDPSHP